MSKLDAKDLDLADRIRKVRRFKGFKESDMAERLGISQRQYGRYENGEQMIPPEKVGAICVILEVEETNLRNFDERMCSSPLTYRTRLWSQNHKPCYHERAQEVQQRREVADRTRGRRARGQGHLG
ncbi:MAG: helix-turn-helix transcriptional regulator [Flavobacteriales bacterium]|nr:helix-turn-helix transcriptional regulator [Flavobacteriales bacterium]